jgi:ornithine cyclodeaminase
LAILGSGVQARTHLEAMLLACPIRRVRVWSRDPAHTHSFAEREAGRHNVNIEPMATAKDAVTGADLICTTTSAKEPVLLGEWLAPGVHINAVGSSVPFTRELDTAAVAKSKLFVDRRESTLNEAGDFLFPMKEGAIGDDHIRGEIGELLLGQIAGRESPKEITLFKSLGLAVEDLASAHHIYQRAREKGMGVALELGGSRDHP